MTAKKVLLLAFATSLLIPVSFTIRYWVDLLGFNRERNIALASSERYLDQFQGDLLTRATAVHRELQNIKFPMDPDPKLVCAVFWKDSNFVGLDLGILCYHNDPKAVEVIGNDGESFVCNFSEGDGLVRSASIGLSMEALFEWEVGDDRLAVMANSEIGVVYLLDDDLNRVGSAVKVE
ncbi:hypothetical protein CA13_17180 [Planctomycetes bacterium CA13]|uniref:Uncharacterized protein n=1 Tax=Novipirellula herctigrandis TaxID=2527986 RepID=A0A5C5YZ13_9BACT|nr:hypothetical protein CA13_17180 [Planctomycetes bacterium CA13]